MRYPTWFTFLSVILTMFLNVILSEAKDLLIDSSVAALHQNDKGDRLRSIFFVILSEAKDLLVDSSGAALHQNDKGEDFEAFSLSS
ncbi:MAG: hypothetical protein GX227_06630 [Clostridiaceae bacterium]|nr:hypothetical protein [Clostridiaceae bacterium]